MNTTVITEDQTGCWLDNHRGHYISRDVIELAVEFGFIIGPFEQYAVSKYDTDSHTEDYPNEGITELCDEAVEWLNSGQDECQQCSGSGMVLEATGAYIPGVTMQQQPVICKACSGSGRGPRISGQNFPPRIPQDYYWSFEDGDFGLWKHDEEE